MYALLVKFTFAYLISVGKDYHSDIYMRGENRRNISEGGLIMPEAY